MQEPGSRIGRFSWSASRPLERPCPRESRGLKLRWKRGLPSAYSRGREPRCGKVEPPIPRRVGGKVYPSARRPSETTEQGVLCAPRVTVRGQRARAWTPCSSLLSELRVANCELCGLRCIYRWRPTSMPSSLFAIRYSLFTTHYSLQTRDVRGDALPAAVAQLPVVGVAAGALRPVRLRVGCARVDDGEIA
jgi:hypothetical protein